LLLRISAIDWAEGGSTGDDAVAIGRAAKAAGVDLVAVVTGGTVADEQRVIQRLYQTPLAERVRLEAGIAPMT
jgi:anthraniloyl-CoA monooxygenase